MTQGNLFTEAVIDNLEFERQAHQQGYQAVAGVDEAGRGPLAGPVVAAAVLLPRDLRLNGVTDSKKLTALQRDRFFDIIQANAVSIGIGMGSVETIDSINILQATRQAMLQAVSQLTPQPDMILIDGITPIDTSIRQRTIKKGDSLSLSIAAASIIAKVTRDRLMQELEAQYPGYGLGAHKGYGCASHMAAIKQLGPSPAHRLTFRGVKEYVPCPSS